MKLGTKWKFECTACGRCCTAPPSLTFGEVEAQSSNFMLEFVIRGVSLKKGRDLETAEGLLRLSPEQSSKKIQHEKDHWSYAKSDEGFTALHAFPMGIPFGEPRRCDMLGSDNLCKIHDTKPMMCGTVPFQANAPDFMSGLALSTFQSYGCMTSDPSSEKPEIFNGYRPTDETYRRALASFRSSMKDDIPVGDLMWTLLGEGVFGRDTMRVILQGRGTMMTMPFDVALIAAVRAGVVTESSASVTMKNQVALADALLRRSPDHPNAPRVESARADAMRYLGS